MKQEEKKELRLHLFLVPSWSTASAQLSMSL
jgi:hypothetical protein